MTRCSHCGSQLSKEDHKISITSWLDSVELSVNTDKAHINIREKLIPNYEDLLQAPKGTIIVRVRIVKGWDHFSAPKTWGAISPEASISSANEPFSHGANIISSSREKGFKQNLPPLLAGAMGGSQEEIIISPPTLVESLLSIYNKPTESSNSDTNEDTNQIEFFSTLVQNPNYLRIPFPPHWKRLLMPSTPKHKFFCSVDVVHSANSNWHCNLTSPGDNNYGLKILVRTLPDMRLELPRWLTEKFAKQSSLKAPETLLRFELLWNGPSEKVQKCDEPGRRKENYPAKWQVSSKPSSQGGINELQKNIVNDPSREDTTETAPDGAKNYQSGILSRKGNSLDSLYEKPADLAKVPQPFNSLWLDEYRYHIIELHI
jgi:hypothetical protein